MNYQIYLQTIQEWFFLKGIKVVIILIIAWIIIRIFRFAVSRIIKLLVERAGRITGNGVIQEQRIETISKVFKSSISIVVWLIAFLTILPELGVNITPLLAGAGLVGLAIGMGAKDLIQDYLSGLFILLEDQYRVGEEIEAGGVKGKVIDLNLRKTVLKDKGGTTHFIPNGQVKTASNFSRK